MFIKKKIHGKTLNVDIGYLKSLRDVFTEISREFIINYYKRMRFFF